MRFTGRSNPIASQLVGFIVLTYSVNCDKTDALAA